MHPEDMNDLGLEAGELIAITSRVATVHAVVLPSDEIRPGLVSMSHAYGLDVDRLAPSDDIGTPQPFSMGNHTGALASGELDYQEPHTGIPRMSAIPVHVERGQRPT